MKLSEKTRIILDNFSKINSSAYFFGGHTQKIMNASKSVFAEVTLDEEFPSEFGIYELTKFLSVLSLFDDPELTFSEKNVLIEEGTTKSTFWFTPKDVLTNCIIPQDKSISLKSVDLSFSLSKEDLKYLKSASSVINLTNFVIEGDGNNIVLLVKDADNDTSNKMSKIVGSTTETFKYVGDIANLKMHEDDYDVKVDKSGIIEFSSKNNKLKYWIAIRKNK